MRVGSRLKMKKCVLLDKKNVFLIGVLVGEKDNEVRWVTDVEYCPKVCKWEQGKEAFQFLDEKWALQVAEGLLLNGNKAFVAEFCEIVTAIKND